MNLFDKINNIGGGTPIEEYLKRKGFYLDTMKPKFVGYTGYKQLTLNMPCLKHQTLLYNDSILSIFINSKDIYFEVQTSYGTYKLSNRYNPEQYDSVERIDNLLNDIVIKVLESYKV